MTKIEKKKQELLALLDRIGNKQKEIDHCCHCYRSLEKELEKKRGKCFNSSERDNLTRAIATLNREFEEKIDLLYEDLNEELTNGHDLAIAIGKEIGHDFKTLWHYMTDSEKGEVKLDHVLRDIEYIKKDFLTSR